MKKFLFLLLLPLFFSCNNDNDARVIVITLDGYRWQEVFRGADSTILSNPNFVPDPWEITQYFWRPTVEERRELLFPFIWSYVPQHGYLIGNRDKNSKVHDGNNKWYSYPCYCEMFSGQIDNSIDTNNPVENVHNNVLEAANTDPRYAGSVMAITSWESIRWAFANERAGIPASSGREPLFFQNPTVAMYEGFDTAMPDVFGYSERHDVITFGYAMETLKEKHPKVLYVGFGDTDEWGHERKYDVYLRTAQATDNYIRQIVEYCESDPFYKGKTTYMILTDHGRGNHVTSFNSHGGGNPGSGETWFIAFGKGIPVLGETSDNGTFYVKQLAGTIAKVLGIEFTPDNGEACDAIDPTYYKPEEKKVYSFDAVNAKPKGNGVSYTYSEGNFMSVEDVLKAPVKARGVSPTCTTGIKKTEDHFGIVYKGLIKIPADGEYALNLATDDGSKLIFNGKEIMDLNRDGGGCGQAWLNLKAGYHRFEIQYFENYGGDVITLGIEGKGLSHLNIPESMLFYE